MSALPDGVVTFVFTDVKGSIRLWNDAPDAMMEALDRHDLIVEEVVKDHQGHSVKPRGEGDSRFLVFADARDAVAAISEIQVRLYGTQWSTPRPLTVRAAVHTGGADFRTDDYYGPEVNKTARLRDMAEGGQTLISKSTRDLVFDSLPERVTLTDLGEHRLRDITEHERIFQLNPPGLPTAFQFEAPLLELGFLGPLRVVSRGSERDVTSAKQRALLTLLAINAGVPLSWERIVEEVWGDGAPASGKKTVGYHMSQLRDALDPDRGPATKSAVANREGGYVLDVPKDDIDIHQFESLVQKARAQPFPDSRGRMAAQALELWRGDPFPGLRYEDFTQRTSAHLHELRMEAHEILARSRLDRGDVVGALNQISPLVDDHPYRESLAALHVKALYRSNRQADALAAIDKTRTALLEDLGLSLGPELVQLEDDILAHSPKLRRAADQAPMRGFLPQTTDSFFGRETELSLVRDLLGGYRMVTLVGLGGIGKSRLALEIAHHLRREVEGGSWLIELARIRQGTHVPTAIAETLGLEDVEGDGVVEAAAKLIGESNALLILDNCEHVLSDVAEFITAIKDLCPDLRVLATSRVALEVPGERVLPVGPLGIQVGSSSATDLFTDRAAGISAELELEEGIVAEVCERVGGIPLAIELAASRLRVLSLRELNSELENRLDLVSSVSGAVPERQKTLTTVIDWSIEAAGVEAARLLEALSVARGGFTLDAAMALGGSEERLSTLQMLEDLASQSLIVKQPPTEGHSRFRLLEPVREYAGARLREHGEYERAVVAHREFFGELVTEAYEELSGGDQQAWLRRLDLEVDNVRAALDRARDQPIESLPIAARIWRYWLFRGRAFEGINELTPLLEACREPSMDRLLGLYGHGVLASNVGLLDEAEHSLDECIREAEEVGDVDLVASANLALSGVVYLVGEAARAVGLLEEAIASFRQVGDTPAECLTACKLSYMLGEVGREVEADALLEAMVQKCAEAPLYIKAELLLARGLAAVANGDLDLADELNQAAKLAGEEGGFLDQQAWAQFGLGNAALSRGDSLDAQKAYSAAIRVFDQIGEMEGIVLTRAHLGVALAMNGETVRAKEVLETSLSTAGDQSPAEVAFIHEAMAFVSSTAGEPVDAATSIGEAVATRSRTGTITRPPLLAYFRSAESGARSALGSDRFDEVAFGPVSAPTRR